MNNEMKGKRLRDIRRSQIADFNSKGFSQSAIAKTLQISEATVSRDMIFLREQAKKNIQDYIDNLLPFSFSQTINGINAILREAWVISNQHEIDNKEKVQALSLAKDCYSMRLDLLTHAETVSNAMKFISKHKQEIQNKQPNSDRDNSNDDDNTNTIDNNDDQKQEGQSIQEQQQQEQEQEQEEEYNNSSNEVVITTELF